MTAKILNVDLSKEDELFFKKTFEPYADEAQINYLHGWSDSDQKDLKLGKNKDKSVHGEDYYYKKICSQPFSRLTVLFNGDVTPCCVDWSHKLVVGNVKNESLDELWNKQTNPLRKDHIEGNIGKDSPCFNCNYALGHGELEDIDSIKDRLRELYP